jgi:transcriptional regulator with XRE-family HTH domain
MSSMNTSPDSIRAWLSGAKSGNITPNSAALAVGVLDMAEVLQGFAQRLRELRKQKDLSQGQLGILTDLHYTHIGRYERGSSRPSGDTLQRLAAALGVTSDYLMEGAATEAAKARFEDHELLQQFQEVEKLPEDDKHVVKRLLDAFLMKKQLQALVR